MTAEEIILSELTAKKLNKCSELLKNSGIIYELTSDVTFNATLLCAPDKAYADLPASVSTLLADETNGQDSLANFLHYQILTQAYTANELLDQAPRTYETLLGFQPINTTKDGDVLKFLPFPQGTESPSELVSPEIYQDRFVTVHLIDAPLIPPMELLDPSDIPFPQHAPAKS